MFINTCPNRRTNYKIDHAKFLHIQISKLGLPDRVGAHLTCRNGSEPELQKSKVQIWIRNKRNKFVHVQCQTFDSQILHGVRGPKGKALGFATCSTRSACGEANWSWAPCSWACRASTMIAWRQYRWKLGPVNINRKWDNEMWQMNELMN